jgi:hypothetical protein
MPLQNRVEPFGTLHAVTDRGAWMGNRGVLHDNEQVIRSWARGRRWIICTLSFGDRRRTLMAPGNYTELFFLDEATAFAAGHRPCAECRRASYLAYREGSVVDPDPVSAIELDRQLDGERRSRRSRVMDRQRCAELTAGAMVDLNGQPHLLWAGQLRPWSFAGYGLPVEAPTTALPVLTPPMSRRTLAAGYPLQIHESVGGA